MSTTTESTREKVVTADTVSHAASNEKLEEQPPSTAFQLDLFTDSHHKTALERRLLWKQDLLIVPLLALCYFASWLDRNSLGNAKVLGLTRDLDMTAQDYSNCANMFNIGYVLFMIPGNVCLRWLPPMYQLGGATLTFATLVCIFSTASSYTLVLVIRILIGFAQGLVQGIGIYISLWYTRNEVATRAAIYFSAATLSGAFSGLIAYGIGNDLTLAATGREPWRWLFIVEGSIALGTGVLLILALPPFPDQMKDGQNWLFSKEEIALALRRVETWNTRGSKVEVRQIWVCLVDWKCWTFAIMSGASTLALSSIGNFLPTFIEDFGYTAAEAQLFSVIPYGCAFVTLPLIAWLSDRYKVKGPFIILALAVTCIGYIILLTVTSGNAVRMFATCLITAGLYPAVVLKLAWLALNTGGFTKRGTTWALAEIVGQCLAIMGASEYIDGPRYIKGHSIVLAFLVMAAFIAMFLMWWMRVQNVKRDRILADLAERNEIHPHAGKSLEDEFDHHINFRYIL